MRKVLCLMALVLVAGSADARGGQFELTPQVGYRLFSDVEIDVIDLAPELEVDESESYGVTLGIPLSRNLQLELLVNRQESELREEGGIFRVDRTLSDFDITYYQVGVLYQWSGDQISPFVVAGAGLANLEAGEPFSDEDDRPAISFGGGIKVHFNDHLGLRVEGRGYYVDLGGDDDDDDDIWEDEDSIFQGEITLGLIIGF